MDGINFTDIAGAGISIASPLFTIFILWKVGVIGKRNGNGNGYQSRIKDLEDFREIAEGNHFHEIEGLRGAVGDLQKDLNNFRVEVEKRLTRLESK